MRSLHLWREQFFPKKSDSMIAFNSYAKRNESKTLNSTVQLNAPVSNHVTGVALATTRSTNAA